MKKTLILIAFAVWFGFIIPNAGADTIDLSIGDAYFVGKIIDDVPASEAAELAYIGDLILVPAGVTDVVGTTDYTGDDDTGQTEIYDRALSTLATLPPVIDFIDKDESGDDEWDDITIAGDIYVLGKYDQDSAGALVWLVNVNYGDKIKLPDEFNRRGISHIALYSTSTTVPEPATLLLLGFGLIGLWGLRKKIKK